MIKVPGLTSNNKFTDDFVNDLMYKRNVIWHSTKMLLQGYLHIYGNPLLDNGRSR